MASSNSGAHREAERVAELYSYEILDTPRDPAFDHIAELAAMICGTQSAAITLVDRDRLWFRACYGAEFDEIDRADSVCATAIMHDHFFEVADLHSDPRFAHSKVIREAHIRFYGGSQLVNGRGHRLGALCVHDPEPRELAPHQRRALEHLSSVVVSLMEAHRRGRRLAWFGRLIDEVSDEILIADAETWRYLHVNRTAIEHMGYTLDQLRQRTAVDVTPSLTPGQFAQLVARLEEGEEVVTYEGTRQRADGSMHDVEVRLQRVETAQRPVLISQVRDITAGKEIARLKDEFVSVVSHELRTPLTAIHGALKLIESGAAGELPERAGQLLAIAVDGSRRLRSIVDDILDLEQVAAGRMTFDITAIQAAALLRKVATAYGTAASGGLRLEVAADPSITLMGDERRVEQVLGNLVSNALKFAPPNTVVTLAAGPVEDRVRLSVTDRGPGIPQEFRARLFKRFSQADMGSSRSIGGSGLGLSIVKRMTEQMNGRVGFESEPGRTCFYIELPEVGA